MTSETAPKRDLKAAREELLRIINLCKTVELKGLDPYLVDVEDLIKIIKNYFPMWRASEDLCLDAEALSQIASIVKLQSEWVKKRATKLYRDPLLIEERIRGLSIDKLAEIFLKVWRPVIEFEQLTARSFGVALKYWIDLLPLNERWKKTEYVKTETQMVSREEAIKEGAISDESFIATLEKMWLELKSAYSKSGKVRYWDFITADTYEETVKRAYLTSFLVTYGYAGLEINLLEDEIFVVPREEPAPPLKSETISFPITIDFEEWRRWKERREGERKKHITL